jgi:ABC-2 type transport system permease protein
MSQLGQLGQIVERRAALATLVRRDLKVRYAASFLGYLWTILDPLMMAGIYFFIFTQIFTGRNVGYTPYFLFLLCGLLAWQWFSSAVTDLSPALVSQARLVRSTNLPRQMWVLRVVLAKGIEFLLSLPVLAGFVVYFAVQGQAGLRWGVLLFPLGVLLQAVLLTGLGLILAPITVLVRDVQRVVRIALRVAFYLSPIIYSVQAAPASIRTVLALNPMTAVTEIYRAGLFSGDADTGVILIGTAVSLVLLGIGLVVFSKLESAVLKEI